MNKKPKKKTTTEKKKYYPQSQERLKRIYQSPLFKTIVKMAGKKKGKELNKYINEIRKTFNLSLYWEDTIRLALENPRLNLDEHLAGIYNVVRSKDKVINKDYYYLIIYPETTQRDVVRAYSKISNNYEESGCKSRMRMSKKFELEMSALLLRKKGKSYKEIAKYLSKEGDKKVMYYEVSDYIKKAKEKFKVLSSD